LENEENTNLDEAVVGTAKVGDGRLGDSDGDEDEHAGTGPSPLRDFEEEEMGGGLSDD